MNALVSRVSRIIISPVHFNRIRNFQAYLSDEYGAAVQIPGKEGTEFSGPALVLKAEEAILQSTGWRWSPTTIFLTGAMIFIVGYDVAPKAAVDMLLAVARNRGGVPPSVLRLINLDIPATSFDQHPRSQTPRPSNTTHDLLTEYVKSWLVRPLVSLLIGLAAAIPRIVLI